MVKLESVLSFVVTAGYFIASFAHSVVNAIASNTVSQQDLCINSLFDESQLHFANYDSIAGSPPLQRSLAAKEELIYTVVKEYLHNIDLNDNQNGGHTRDCYYQAANRYIQHFEATTGLIRHGHGPAPDRPSNVSWNPILVYHMFNRMWKLLAPLITWLDMQLDTQLSLRKQIVDLLGDIGFPNEEDVRLAIRSILRIQHVYDLDTLSIANGWMDGFNTGVALSSWDCNAIGEQALADQKYAAAVEWFEVALRGSQPVLKSILPISEDTLRINLKRSLYDLISEMRTQVGTHQARTAKDRTETYYDRSNYFGVCSGATQQSEVVKAKLFCYHETKAHPAWTINPLKVELLSLQPLVIMKYHSLISDTLIQKIQNEAIDSMARSGVRIEEVETDDLSDIRTSMSGWINDNNRAEFKILPEIIELITGLRVRQNSSSDHMQVASYSAGSHYLVHLDATGLPDLESENHGDRIATFMFYLTNVVKGGGTAFPQSQVQVIPDRGSAVLWYNVRKNGNVDYTTWHGSCPVVFGEKWIANKWVFTNDQMFHPNYQCSRDPNAKIEVAVNGIPVSDFY